MNSRPRRAHYSRGSFSVTSGPHQWGHEGSLGPPFGPGPLTVKGPVRPAFGLALHGGFLSRLSRPLGPLDIVSRGCRPSQTAHLSLSREQHSLLGTQSGKAGVPLAPPSAPESRLHGLPATLCSPDRIPTAGCSKAPRGLLVPLGVPRLLTRMRVHPAPGGDSGALVDPFMHVGTYPTRHLATLRGSELPPPLTGP